MNYKEIEIVSKLPASKRYEYFIKKIVDFGEVWGLYDENGWVMSEDEDGNFLIPFWPKKEFAELYAIDEWKNCKPEPIELGEFMQEFLPLMKEDGFKPSIFFNNENAIVVDIDTFITHLETELEKY